MSNSITFQLPRKLVLLTMLLTIFLVTGSLLYAQVSAVNTLGNLNFGTFSPGANGGTISVSSTGSTTTTGTVMPLAFSGSNDVSAAQFEVEAVAGTVISISNGPDVNLTGSNGGTMTLHLGSTNPMTPFAVGSLTGRTLVTLGGTLLIGNAASSPPGAYTGTFYITFNNE